VFFFYTTRVDGGSDRKCSSLPQTNRKFYFRCGATSPFHYLCVPDGSRQTH